MGATVYADDLLFIAKIIENLEQKKKSRNEPSSIDKHSFHYLIPFQFYSKYFIHLCITWVSTSPIVHSKCKFSLTLPLYQLYSPSTINLCNFSKTTSRPTIPLLDSLHYQYQNHFILCCLLSSNPFSHSTLFHLFFMLLSSHSMSVLSIMKAALHFANCNVTTLPTMLENSPNTLCKWLVIVSSSDNTVLEKAL